jgi:hypothetical protein
MRRRQAEPLVVSGHRLGWPVRVPRSARFVEKHASQGYLYGDLVHASGKLYVGWSLHGGDPAPIVIEIPYDARGRRHGVERTRHPNGQVEWQVRWVQGQMDGPARQFDEGGRCLVASRFVRGTGLDVWVGCSCVTEVRAMRNSVPHGFETWGHPSSPWEENHWIDGLPAGITRRWSGDKLEPGHPKFLVEAEEVSATDYSRARHKDPRLPPYRKDDNLRGRSLPKGLTRVWLRPDIRAKLMKPPELDGDIC